MIIVVEGTDGTGKGTLCPALAAKLNAALYKTPPEHMRAEQDHVNATANDLDHYKFFVQVIQTASPEIVRLSETGHVVVDRYWITTIVYHEVMGVTTTLSDFGEIVQPDLTIYLSVSDEVQISRIEGRGKSPGDIRMENRQHLIRAKYDEVLASVPNVVRIDTSKLTPTQVLVSAYAACVERL